MLVHYAFYRCRGHRWVNRTLGKMKDAKASLTFYSISFVVRADLSLFFIIVYNDSENTDTYHIQRFWNLAQLEKLFLKINILDSIQTPLLCFFKFASFLSRESNFDANNVSFEINFGKRKCLSSPMFRWRFLKKKF